MPDTVHLSTFPSTKLEALTMLYLQSQDISVLTPEQLLEKYNEVYSKLSEHNKELRKNKRSLSSRD